MRNYSKLLWNIDAYKVGHMNQYNPEVEFVHSVFQLRSCKTFTHVPVFGLQYLLTEYLTNACPTHEEVDELLAELKMMGVYHDDIKKRLYDLAELGYLPIKVNAVPEGTIITTPNAIATIENTVAGFHWLVGFVETLLLQWWSSLSTAAQSLQYRRIAEYYFNKTSDLDNVKFNVHDFGLRGASCPEHGAITGAAHALSFDGSDTIIAIPFLREYYGSEGFVVGSVPASEHSVMCSFGREREIEAFEHMLDTYENGIVSIVADTYDWYNVLDTILPSLKDKILARDGRIVVRPDSGVPEKIINGETLYHMHNYEYSTRDKGALRMLDEVFGHTVNSKGYKVLNDKVGLLYGDGMYPARYAHTLHDMQSIGYASDNLVIGVGGILRGHSRDTLGCAIKATGIVRKGSTAWEGIMKDPVTDSGKKSYCGRVKVSLENGVFNTVTEGEDGFNDAKSILATVLCDGTVKKLSWSEVKENYAKTYPEKMTKPEMAAIKHQKPNW
ncbi:MAG: nicotinate phosphoribosyltransferase [Phocaeicola sp.]